LKLTRYQIESAKTENGGWTRKQLAEWGVSWPPRKGWRREIEISSKTGEFEISPAEKERQSMRELYLEKSGWHTFGEMRGE
jgi:hypothetical protein